MAEPSTNNPLAENMQSSVEVPAAVNPYATARARNYALLLLTVVYSFNFIDRQLLAILQESIKVDLDLSDSQLGLLTGLAFAMFYVTAGIPIARLADRANRRNIVAFSVGLWSLMTALSGSVSNYSQLLMARVGVGIGEAGGSPPSHSIISDIFPAEKRASALSIYSTGVNIGIMFGLLLGGWLNEYFGWRVAFVVVGLPGILLAILVRTTLAEPIRGLAEQRQTSTADPSFKDVLSLLWSRLSFRHMAFAAGLNAFASYSASSWTASFMIRTHGMSSGELGTWLALTLGLAGAIGVLGGGLLADKLAPRDKRWYVWLPAITGFISVPFLVAVYMADGPYSSLMLSVVPGVLFNVYLGNAIATTHSLVGLKMRATSSALLFLIINIIGLGFGPSTIGFLSDYLAADYGQDSLRQAMLMVIPVMMFWSACHFYLASKTLRQDLLSAPD